jgi:putative membrane protein
METIVLRTAINTIALWAAARLVDGIEYTTIPSLLGIALVFGVVNSLVRPFLQIIACPLILLTLGLFTFVVNAFLLIFTAQLGRMLGIGFRVSGFGAAFWGALIISIVSVILSVAFRDKEQRT